MLALAWYAPLGNALHQNSWEPYPQHTCAGRFSGHVRLDVVSRQPSDLVAHVAMNVWLHPACPWPAATILHLGQSPLSLWACPRCRFLIKAIVQTHDCGQTLHLVEFARQKQSANVRPDAYEKIIICQAEEEEQDEVNLVQHRPKANLWSSVLCSLDFKGGREGLNVFWPYGGNFWY